ncbi:MAG TPA: lipopolysaccharide biosynthesis protein [Burkholderiales bacterium]|nr:lipopolysaccharide biosynthesis protein [Burkholderiales bacterium]
MSMRKVFAFSYLDRYASLLLFIASSMILARLLSPAEMGVFSVTMVFLSFTAPIKDLGASQYIIQEKNLEPAMIRAAWAIQLGLGLVLAVFVLGVSHLVADFYREPRIKSIMYVLSLNFLLNPLGALTIALLSREMRFGSIAIIRFSGTLTGSLISIFCAWVGFGPISLAYGSLATTLASALASLFFRQKGLPWLPSLSGVRKIVTFGSLVTGISIMNIVREGSPELLLGKLQGMAPTGLFGRAQSLVSIFERLVMDGIYSAALPVFSKHIREDKPIDDIFVRAEALVSGIGWPLLSFLAVFSYPLINLFYGARWDGAVEVTRILCAAISLLIPGMLCGAPLIAMGRTRTAFWLSTTNAIMRLCLAAIGASISLEALGLGIMIGSAINVALWLKTAKPVIGFSWPHFWSEIGKSAIVTAGSMVVPAIVVFFFSLKPTVMLPPLILGGLGALAGYLLTAWTVKHPVWHEIDQIILRRISFVK